MELDLKDLGSIAFYRIDRKLFIEGPTLLSTILFSFWKSEVIFLLVD